MSTHERGSVTRWLGDLKGGDAEAAQPLWDRYFERLVRLARRRLGGAPAPGFGDEEDAALSAFHSVCAGAARGQFPRLSDRADLWRLLVVVTARKAAGQARRARRLRRGGGAVLDEAGLRGDGPDDEAAGLEAVVGTEPTPEFAAMVAEEYTRLLDALGDDGLRRVAVWRLEGYTGDEIAAKLGCTRRTVVRRLDLIREVWSARGRE